MAPEVVGAAAERRTTTTSALSATPAAKAAALSREASRADEKAEPHESRRLTDARAHARSWRWLKVLSLLVLAGAAIAGGSYAAYNWSQQQYYVGEADGHVAIYQGVSQNIGPWELSHVVDQSDIALSDLPDFYRSKLDSTVMTAHVEDARKLVTDLRVQAIKCQTTKAAGGSCGSSNP
jgi:protein phosphatase